MSPIIKITPSGTLTTLNNFSDLDGQNPDGGLVLWDGWKFRGNNYHRRREQHGNRFKIHTVGNPHHASQSRFRRWREPARRSGPGKSGLLYRTTWDQFGRWTGW